LGHRVEEQVDGSELLGRDLGRQEALGGDERLWKN
jgi:hypothetical protein